MVFDKIKEIIVEQLGVDEDSITASTHLMKDLEADSLDAVEIIMAIEDEFDIEVPDEDAENSKSWRHCKICRKNRLSCSYQIKPSSDLWIKRPCSCAHGLWLFTMPFGDKHRSHVINKSLGVVVGSAIYHGALSYKAGRAIEVDACLAAVFALAGCWRQRPCRTSYCRRSQRLLP